MRRVKSFGGDAWNNEDDSELVSIDILSRKEIRAREIIMTANAQ